MHACLQEDESLDLICGDLEIIQAKNGYRFGIDSILLASFVGFPKDRAKRQGPDMEDLPAEAVVDLGTGSGIIPMVLVKTKRVKSACGVEIQPALVDRARRSLAHNKMIDEIEIIQADLRNLEDVLDAGCFDLVTANPPYRTTNSGKISQGEERAIGRHEIKCTLEDVISSAARLLKPLGVFDMVFPTERIAEVFSICERNNMQPARLRLIYGRVDLPSKTCLLETVRGGNNQLKVAPPLIVYKNENDYTPEVEQIVRGYFI
jgi:tRNA1Val (adenine37-N6)-methyltransferase